jgi:hypothetical protein
VQLYENQNNTTNMKQTFLIIILLLTTTLYCISQTNDKSVISFDGFYIAKTGTVPEASVDIHTYIRFYRDGSVYLQGVTSNDPQAVSRWFGRYKKFSQKGNYQIKGQEISIQLSNKDSKDFQLEGLQETKFKGTIETNKLMSLTRDTDSRKFTFEFNTVLDTTTKKYTQYKEEIKLPGEWRVKQVIKEAKQVYFINEDSTIVCFVAYVKSNLPVYKESQNEFETALAYYEWDSKYMNEEQKMEVKKISENKEKAFVIWNAKDENNNNFNLFACQNNLIYNLMISDDKMSIENKIKFLEILYEINKE